jgi:hypothetical protein
MEMTDERIAEIEARCAKATAGEWIHVIDTSFGYPDRLIAVRDEAEDHGYGFVIIRDEHCDRHFKEGRDEENFDFIAAARTDLPDAIEALKREREENERLRRDLAEAKRDSERLDWIETHLSEISIGGHNEDPLKVTVSLHTEEHYQEWGGASMRDAIDVAIAETETRP